VRGIVPAARRLALSATLALCVTWARAETPLTLDEAIALALSSNRTLAAARIGREVARAGEEVARQRPNPELGIEAARETPHEAYTLTFPVELGGKRQRRIDVSEAAAATGEAEVARLTAETRASVRRAYYAVAAAQERLANLEELLGFAERTRDAAKDRFESGDSPRLDLVQADLNAAQIDNDVVTARASLASALTDLNILLARPPGEATSVGADLGAGAVPEPEAAVECALAASAELALADRKIQESEARVSLAHAERTPDLAILGGVTRDAQPEFDTGWRAGISIALPIFTQHAADVRLAENSLLQLQAEREAIASQVEGTVHAAVVLASARREEYARYRDRILPQAIEVEEMATESYRAGQTDLTAMLQAFESVRDIRLTAVEAGLDYQVALSELERAMGTPLR
jgi:cobalt-zinc-cadmium efflux system outer membrane protein